MGRVAYLPFVIVGALVLVATGALVGVLCVRYDDASSTSEPPQETDSSEKAYLGVSVTVSTDGLRVTRVTSTGPAASAGIQAGDIIRSVDGEVVRTPEQLRNAVEAKQPGNEVAITYERGSRELHARATLSDTPPDALGITTPVPGSRPGAPGLESLPADVRERLQRELDAGRLTPQELQRFLRLYQARGDNARAGTVESVNPGFVSGTFILTLKPYAGGENVAVELNESTTVLRGGRRIQPGDLRKNELVLVISMDGGVTAFGVLATGVQN
jgi:membrane-associated protease RseP (regulator of RpoE activity)